MLICAAIVLTLAAATTHADVITDPSQGTLQMTLTVDVAGNATIMNNIGGPLGSNAYEIWSVTGQLDPGGWISIVDMAAIN